MTERRALVTMIVSMAMWGLANPFSDIAMDELTPAQTFIAEITTGTVAFTAMVAIVPSLRPSLRRIPWRIAIPLGLLMPGLCFYLGNIGYGYATITTGVVLLSTEVLFTALGGVWLLREHLSARAAFAIVIGMGGAIAVGLAGQKSSVEAIGQTFTVLGVALPATFIGGAAFVLSALFSGLFAVLVRKYAASTDVIGLTVGHLVAALGMAVVILAGMRIDMPQAIAEHPVNFAAAAMAGLLGSAFAFLLFNSASRKVPTRQTALTLNLIPVVAIVLGGIIGRGWPTPWQLAGATVVLGSLLFLESAEGAPAPLPPH